MTALFRPQGTVQREASFSATAVSHVGQLLRRSSGVTAQLSNPLWTKAPLIKWDLAGRSWKWSWILSTGLGQRGLKRTRAFQAQASQGWRDHLQLGGRPRPHLGPQKPRLWAAAVGSSHHHLGGARRDVMLSCSTPPAITRPWPSRIPRHHILPLNHHSFPTSGQVTQGTSLGNKGVGVPEMQIPDFKHISVYRICTTLKALKCLSWKCPSSSTHYPVYSKGSNAYPAFLVQRENEVPDQAQRWGQYSEKRLGEKACQWPRALKEMVDAREDTTKPLPCDCYLKTRQSCRQQKSLWDSSPHASYKETVILVVH